MRTKSEIIKEYNQTQSTFDVLLMAIGKNYATYSLTNDNTLVPIINQQILVFRKVEAQLRTLEQELANSQD